MKKILVVSGHPDVDHDSVANKTILEELALLLPDAQIDRLDLLYPDYQIDVAAEQAKLVAADIIVLQYPVWWYHFPSLLQKWVEDVFVHGFSHGSHGKALEGKQLIASLTTGAAAEAYSAEGMGVTIETFLAPVVATCRLTRMDFAGYVHTGGVSYLSRSDGEAQADFVSRAREHAARVHALVGQLQE